MSLRKAVDPRRKNRPRLMKLPFPVGSLVPFLPACAFPSQVFVRRGGAAAVKGPGEAALQPGPGPRKGQGVVGRRWLQHEGISSPSMGHEGKTHYRVRILRIDFLKHSTENNARGLSSASLCMCGAASPGGYTCPNASGGRGEVGLDLAQI